MADPNTCEQCGISNHNKPNITIRQSGKGKLVCQPCYDIIHPEEKTIMENISKPVSVVLDKLFMKKDVESLSSSKEKEEKGTFRSSIRRFPR